MASPAAAQRVPAAPDQLAAVGPPLLLEPYLYPPTLLAPLGPVPLAPAPPGPPPQPTGPPEGPAAPAPPAYQIVPRLAIQELATDNVRETRSNKQNDLVTTLAPGISAIADTPHLQGVLDYSPQIVRHLNATDQNRTDHSGFETGIVTFVPNHIFLDTVGSISELSRTGGQNALTNSSTPVNQQTQAISYTVSPRVQYGLTELLNAEAHYAFAQNIFNNRSAAGSTTPTTGNVSNSTDQAGHVQVDTSSNAGPYYSRLSGDVLDEVVASSIISSRRIYAISHNEYAVVRPFALIAEIGYERLTFPQASQLDLAEPTWAVGGRFQPNLSDWLQVTYGQRDGIYGFTGNLRYQVTPLTLFTASYFETLSSAQQIIQQNLTTIGQSAQQDPTSIGHDSFGNFFDANTHLPIFISNPNLSLQNDIFRSAVAQATLSVSYDVDSLSGTVLYQKRNSQLGLTQNDSSLGGFLTWTHDLSDRLKSFAAGGYTLRQVDNQRLATGTAGFSYAFSATMTGSAQYDIIRRDAKTSANSFTENQLTFNLVKSF